MRGPTLSSQLREPRPMIQTLAPFDLLTMSCICLPRGPINFCTTRNLLSSSMPTSIREKNDKPFPLPGS
eukprot:CAMPEP_0172736590 /NCGR_PEP_ID=MMETSP1074-20121228/115472_1 /TAXON_ID=2916 /ORGANISM="Ceratium fusus, Strain PA161109" /LENGTH=68 /DNA_ID=CAMNT_0013565817 /DNA_START=87 /DNA_END=293 /DNA_ORIENTATION=+